MLVPDGLILNKEYTIYRTCKQTGKIHIVYNRVVLVDVEDGKLLELKFVLKKDIKEFGFEGFGLYVNDYSDNYVIQETIK